MLPGTDDVAVGLFENPVLVVDPGMHTAQIRRVDTNGQYGVTCSFDGTVRVWSLDDGRLLRTIRVPSGPEVGRLLATAISPDGMFVAVGGQLPMYGVRRPEEKRNQVLIYARESGKWVGRIKMVRAMVTHLAFSPDNKRLVATVHESDPPPLPHWSGVVLHRGGGVQTFSRDRAWKRFKEDMRSHGCWGAAYAHDGRLALTCNDGTVSVHDTDFRVLVRKKIPDGGRPYAVAFSPRGDKVAVTSYDIEGLWVFDLRRNALRHLCAEGRSGGGAYSVAWSVDGSTVYVGEGDGTIRGWSEDGYSLVFEKATHREIIAGLKGLAGGDLFVAAAYDWIARLRPDGSVVWECGPAHATFSGQKSSFAVSDDGRIVDFSYERGLGRARFELRHPPALPRLAPEPPADAMTTPPIRKGVFPSKWEKWNAVGNVHLAGVPLLRKDDKMLSHALSPRGETVVIGSNWQLQAFHRNGNKLWGRNVASDVLAVNVTRDGRLVVTAGRDGTVRWYRLNDGTELLAFMPFITNGRTGDWVAWTPEGLYAATPGARTALRWHINRGWEAAAEAVPVHEVKEQLRPEVLALVLQEMDEVRALGLAERAKVRSAIRQRTGMDIGGTLLLLTIGVSKYAKGTRYSLDLSYAAKDADDIAHALEETQGKSSLGSLYAAVKTFVLRDEDAGRSGIYGGFGWLRNRAKDAAGSQRNLAVIHFSCHGTALDGSLYLLPHDADPTTTDELVATALSFDELRKEILKVAQFCRVLVLLDACHSGAATMDGMFVQLDPKAALAQLAAAGVSVLASSGQTEISREDERWQNGAFTKAFVEALGSRADRDRDGMLTLNDIEWYVGERLRELTARRQTLSLEKRFDGIMFAAGL